MIQPVTFRSEDEVRSFFVEKPSLGFSWSPEKLWQVLPSSQAVGSFVTGQLVSLMVYRSLPQALEVTLIWTVPHHRNQGHARHLLQELLICAKREGKAVWLETHDQNQAALKLYKAVGFQRLGIRNGYYGPGQSAVILSAGDLLQD